MRVGEVLGHDLEAGRLRGKTVSADLTYFSNGSTSRALKAGVVALAMFSATVVCATASQERCRDANVRRSMIDAPSGSFAFARLDR